MVDSPDPRRRVQLAVLERGTSLAALSRALGRNAAYLHQWITRESPRVLPERDRRALAAELGIPERDLMEPKDCVTVLDDEELAEAVGRAIWERDPDNLPWETVHEQWQPIYRGMAKAAIDYLRPLVRDGRFR